MCRIAYIPEPKKVDWNDLADLFDYLDSSQGGDGMGVATIYNGQIRVVRGLSKGIDDLALTARESEGPALFHTRRATTGPVCDYLCQPFVVDNTAIVHNGLWRDWDDVATELIIRGLLDAHYPINDSLTAAVMAAKFGRYSLEVITSGVFVGMTINGAWLHLRGGSFEWCGEDNIYASDFPKDWPSSSKKIMKDSIAILHSGGPGFEEGGLAKTSTIPRIPGIQAVRVYDPETDTWESIDLNDYNGRTWNQSKGRWEKKKEKAEESKNRFADMSFEELEAALEDDSLEEWEIGQAWKALEKKIAEDMEMGNMKMAPPEEITELTDDDLRIQLNCPTLREHKIEALWDEWERRNLVEGAEISDEGIEALCKKYEGYAIT